MITTKKEMSEIAITLFQEHGYEHISIAKICQALDVTRGSFYHHFESKSDLLFYWFTQTINEFIQFDNSLSTPKAILKKFILDYASLVSSVGKDLMYYIFVAELELKGEHFYIDYEEREKIIALVNDAKLQGEITSSLKTEQLIDMFSASFLGTIVLWRFKQDEINIIDNIEQIFETIYQ